MSLLTTFHLTWRKRRFKRQFKPLGLKKRRTFLISVPSEPAKAMATLSFLGGLQSWGQMILLVPHGAGFLYRWLPEKYYQRITYAKSARYFTRETKILRPQLQDKQIDFLIELNAPVNISLPDLASIERRVCFYDMANFPYYNIMMKDGYTSLHEFFSAGKVNPGKVLRFTDRTKTQVRTEYGKRKPLCFVNGSAPAHWNGDLLVLGKDIPVAHHDVLHLLHCADAYCGHRDVLHDLACAFKKTIIDQ